MRAIFSPRLGLLLGTLGFFLSMTACNRGTQYLYESIKPAPVFKSMTPNLKQTLGASAVDILWVIDNSGSMETYQEAVIQNTKTFIDQFSQNRLLDWKMGLIATDAHSEPYVGFTGNDQLNSMLNPADVVQRFQQAVGRLGTMGAGIEQAFIPVSKALKDHPNFLRKDAELALVFLTDAEEQSDNTSEIEDLNLPPMDTKEFADFMGQQKGGLAHVHSYGIFAASDFSCESSDDRAITYRGSRYEAFFNQTGGKTYKLCDPNFGALLAQLGKDIVKTVVTPNVPLDSRPVASTIKVDYKGTTLPGGLPAQGGVWLYDFDLNALIFNSLDFAADDPNATVTVTYQEDHGIDYTKP